MKNTFEIQDLSVGYKDQSIVENLNFGINSGELCTIVGVNGIGKSTLLRTLGRLQPKLGGQVKLNGIDLDSITYGELAKMMSLVLTEPIASRNLTVTELIALGRHPHTNWLGTLSKLDKELIYKSLQLFKLEDLKHRKCFELSDGQLQRVLIARAMAQDTPIILLDEPTTHLDISHKVEIFKLLQDLAHQHEKIILLTTHEIELAIQLSDKMLLMDGNENPFGEPCELIEKGSFENLFPNDVVWFDSKTGSFKVKK